MRGRTPVTTSDRRMIAEKGGYSPLIDAPATPPTKVIKEGYQPRTDPPPTPPASAKPVEGSKK